MTLQNLPAGIGSSYVENIHAIYSLAFAVTSLREDLEARGVRG